MSIFNWINFPPLGDSRGSLISSEGSKTIPFDIKRIYFIFDTKSDVARGFHAHKKLQQVAVCVSGKCRRVLDNGNVREEAWLNSPTKAVFINDMTWREMRDFSSDCVLLVLASEYYDENDYIRDYQDFIRAL